MLDKVLIKTDNIGAHKATFIVIKAPKKDARQELVFKELSDGSWISKISSFLQSTYIVRLKGTIDHFESLIKDNNSSILQYIGEKIVTICSNIAIEENLNFRRLPLGDVFKSRADGNGGFDFYNENTSSWYILFGEGKYVNGVNAYSRALAQIRQFINEQKDVNDIGDLQNLVSEQSIVNFTNGIKSFSTGFSMFSEGNRIPQILENIKENDHFKELISIYDIVIVGVMFDE